MKVTNKASRAILTYLLTGKTLNLITFNKLTGYFSVSRELRRKIEVPLQIELDRKWITKKKRFKESINYLEYSLNKNDFSRVKKILNAR